MKDAETPREDGNRLFAAGVAALELVATLHEWAGLQREQGNLSKARALLVRALAIQTAYPERCSLRDWATLHYHVGLVCEETGKDRRAMRRNLRAAARHYTTALRWARHMPPDEAGLTADIADHLANVCSSLKEHKRAMAFYYLALAIRKKRYGAQHASVAATLNDLALALLCRNHYDRAERALRHALAITEVHSDVEQIDVTPILNNLAVALAERRHFERSISLLQRALSMQETRLVKRHNQLLTTLWNLARMQALAGARPAAAALYHRAWALQVRAHGRTCADTRQLEREQAAVQANRLPPASGSYWMAESGIEWDPADASPSAESSPSSAAEDENAGTH